MRLYLKLYVSLCVCVWQSDSSFLFVHQQQSNTKPSERQEQHRWSSLSLSLGLPLYNSLMNKSSLLLFVSVGSLLLFFEHFSSTSPSASLGAGSVTAVVCRTLSTPTGLCLSVVTGSLKPLCHFPLSSGLHQVNPASNTLHLHLVCRCSPCTHSLHFVATALCVCVKSLTLRF